MTSFLLVLEFVPERTGHAQQGAGMKKAFIWIAILVFGAAAYTALYFFLRYLID